MNIFIVNDQHLKIRSMDRVLYLIKLKKLAIEQVAFIFKKLRKTIRVWL